MRNSPKIYQKNFESYLKMNKNIYRRVKEPDLESINVITLTLDAEKYLEKTIDVTYHKVSFGRHLMPIYINRMYKKCLKMVNWRELLLC